MKYKIHVRTKDVCKNKFHIILDTEIKKYNLDYGSVIINLFEEFKIFEKNITEVNFTNKVGGKLKFDNIDDDKHGFNVHTDVIGFEFDTEEDLFYFRLKTNAEILKIEEKTTNEY